jgi:hypothetical protein
VAGVRFHAVVIGFAFSTERLTGFAQLIVLMDPLHGLFETDRDEQADADGSDVDDEVFPGVGGFVGRVDVEHGKPFTLFGGRRFHRLRFVVAVYAVADRFALSKPLWTRCQLSDGLNLLLFFKKEGLAALRVALTLAALSVR